MKKVIWIVVVVVLVGLVWFGFSKRQNQTSDSQPIKIGGAFSLTGIGASWGEAERNASQMAIDEINNSGGINGARIEMVVEDTATNNTKTVSAVLKLINIDKVKIILGPSWLDSVGGGALPFSENNDIIMVTSSAGITAIQNPKIYPNIFSTWYRSDKEVEQLANYLLDNGKKNIALLMQVDPYWDDLSLRVKKVIESRGETVTEIHFASGETDFKTYFLKLKTLHVDSIVFGFNSDKELLSLLKQRQQIYPDVPMYTTEYIEEFISNPDYVGLMVNMAYIGPKKPEGKFSEEYKKRFNQDAVFSATNAYDATRMVLQAMKDGHMDTKAIREYLKNNEFDTVTFGKTRFDELGGVTTGEYVVKNINQ